MTHRIALVYVDGWNVEIVGSAKDSFAENLKKSGFPTDTHLDFYTVPGSLEIPLVTKKLAESGKYDLIAAAGFIVNGRIYRHEFVATAVIDGMMRVQLDSGIPVISMVLTPIDENFDEHKAEDVKWFTEHMVKKGEEGAKAALATLKTHDSIKEKAKAA